MAVEMSNDSFERALDEAAKIEVKGALDVDGEAFDYYRYGARWARSFTLKEQYCGSERARSYEAEIASLKEILKEAEGAFEEIACYDDSEGDPHQDYALFCCDTAIKALKKIRGRG